MAARSDLLPDDPELASILESFVAKANETILVTDTDLDDASGGPTIRYVNSAAQSLLGQGTVALVGRQLGTLYPPASFPRILEQMRIAQQRDKPAEFEAQAIGKDGTLIWMHEATIPIFAVTGRLSSFVRIGRNVTARKRIEAEREATQRLLASIFGVIDQALCVVDDMNRLTMINTAVTRKLGWSVFDLIGKPITKLVDEASRKSIELQLNARDEQDQILRLSTKFLHRGGAILPGEFVSTVLLQPDGRHFRVITLAPGPVDPIAPAGATLETTVRSALAKGGSPGALVAGKLQLVGLAEVRNQMGDKWPQISEQVFALADRILRRHLVEGDVVRRTADDGFLVCFKDLSEQEANLKAAEVAKEIHDRLTGEMPEMHSARVEGFAGRISIEEHEAGTDQAVIQALERRLSRERKRLEGAALEVMRSGLPTAEVVFQRVRTETNHPAPFTYVRLPRPLETSLGTLKALGRADYSLEAEMLLLTGSAERLLSELTLNKTDLILATVRMTTLAQRREAERWLHVARTLGPPAKRRLVVEISELSRDTARTRLTDMMMTIGQIFRAVAFELPATDQTFINGLPGSVPLVTIPANRLANEDGIGHALAAAKLVKILSSRNCRLIVKEVTSPAMAIALSKAGVGLMLAAQEDRAPAA
ncbi:MAG TPA: PAS domain S-box protein [Aliidongia sp.]|nr:PAS domain S-box protein [Aliidongia sp.]